MYRCESWTIKVEQWRIDAFELWCWRKLLRVPWTTRRSKPTIQKEINPEYSLEGLMLKLQYFGHLMQRANSFEKTLLLGKIEGRRRRGGCNRAGDGWMALPTQWHELSKLQEILKGREACVLQSMGSQRVGHNWVTEQGTATSIFAWRIPWTEEPGRLHSMASQRVLMLRRD